MYNFKLEELLVLEYFLLFVLTLCSELTSHWNYLWFVSLWGWLKKNTSSEWNLIVGQDALQYLAFWELHLEWHCYQVVSIRVDFSLKHQWNAEEDLYSWATANLLQNTSTKPEHIYIQAQLEALHDLMYFLSH